MGRKASSFARGRAKFKPQPRVLILCEDKKSCRTYLGEGAQHFRCHADVEIAHVGKTDPRSIVVEAKTRLTDYDLVFCVIDRDAHETFEEALANAALHPVVNVIASYPCYEYWLLLHFRKSRKPYVAVGGRSAADQATSDLRKQVGMATYAKGEADGLFAQLLHQLPAARVRAAQTLDAAVAEESMNPSTRLHELIELFEALAKPQRL